MFILREACPFFAQPATRELPSPALRKFVRLDTTPCQLEGNSTFGKWECSHVQVTVVPRDLGICRIHLFVFKGLVTSCLCPLETDLGNAPHFKSRVSPEPRTSGTGLSEQYQLLPIPEAKMCTERRHLATAAVPEMTSYLPSVKEP